MNYFKECKTLDEAKMLYYSLAMQLHPDRGGETATFQNMLNEFHNFKPTDEKFTGEFEKWDGKQYSYIINELLKVPNIKIIICGSWIWLQGDTKPVKEQIKAIDTGELMRRGFSKNKLQWYFSPRGYRKQSRNELSFNEIANMYGYTEVEQETSIALIN